MLENAKYRQKCKYFLHSREIMGELVGTPYFFRKKLTGCIWQINIKILHVLLIAEVLITLYLKKITNASTAFQLFLFFALLTSGLHIDKNTVIKSGVELFWPLSEKKWTHPLSTKPRLLKILAQFKHILIILPWMCGVGCCIFQDTLYVEVDALLHDVTTWTWWWWW